jgi:hypothetical protein
MIPSPSRIPLARNEWPLVTSAGLGALLLVGLSVHSVPAFQRMFDTFGGSLPWPTRLLLMPGVLPGVAMLGVAAGVTAVLAPLSPASRRLLLWLAVLLPVLCAAGFHAGMYLPVFTLNQGVR